MLREGRVQAFKVFLCPQLDNAFLVDRTLIVIIREVDAIGGLGVLTRSFFVVAMLGYLRLGKGYFLSNHRINSYLYFSNH